MYPVGGVLLNYSADVRQNFIYKRHTLVGFLPVEFKEDCSTVQGLNDRRGAVGTQL